MLKRGNPVPSSSSIREMSWMLYRDSRMIWTIFRIRTSPLSSDSSAHRAMNPQSWIANVIARKRLACCVSNGQLMKTLLL
jgi:hypothetical protein